MKKLCCILLASLLLLAGCSSKPAESATGKFKAGTYTATADGNNAPVTVEVVFTTDAIESVTVTEHNETAGIADPAIERIPNEIIETQSLTVDTVGGATVTSNAILTAVEDAVVQAGGKVEELKSATIDEPVEKTKDTYEADVVVVGSGITGLAAALSAKEAGAEKVVVLEKMATTGGTTALAGGYLICVDSELYADSGVDDSLETFKKYWDERMNVSGAESGYPDEERADYIFGLTGNTVDWLAEKGVTWDDEIFTGFGPYPVAANPNGGRGLVDEMVKIAEDQGIEILLECRADTLVFDGDRVVGVAADSPTATITFKAPAVILATGGISNNAELVKEYSPKVANAQTISMAAAGATGDGLLMALEAGAVPFENFFTSIWATTIDPEFAAAIPEASTLQTAGQLGVNAMGERFGNEMPVYTDALGSDMIQNGDAPFWFIYDSRDEANTAILEKGVEAGVVAKGETIEELAEAMMVDATTLKETYNRYLAVCAAGEDADYGKGFDYLISLDKAPFYAVKFYPTTFGSQGGVKTDEQGRVVNANNEAISGLYAAGEMSNRYFYNENYVLAASLGIYATTGRIAGATAASDIAQ